MKKAAWALAISVAFVVSSCGSQNADKNASSTPIDSTNLNGTAPAQYDAQDPANPDSPKNQGANEQGLRANNANTEDSAKGRVVPNK